MEDEHGERCDFCYLEITDGGDMRHLSNIACSRSNKMHTQCAMQWIESEITKFPHKTTVKCLFCTVEIPTEAYIGFVYLAAKSEQQQQLITAGRSMPGRGPIPVLVSGRFHIGATNDLLREDAVKLALDHKAYQDVPYHHRLLTQRRERLDESFDDYIRQFHETKSHLKFHLGTSICMVLSCATILTYSWYRLDHVRTAERIHASAGIGLTIVLYEMYQIVSGFNSLNEVSESAVKVRDEQYRVNKYLTDVGQRQPSVTPHRLIGIGGTKRRKTLKRKKQKGGGKNYERTEYNISYSEKPRKEMKKFINKMTSLIKRKAIYFVFIKYSDPKFTPEIEYILGLDPASIVYISESSLPRLTGP